MSSEPSEPGSVPAMPDDLTPGSQFSKTAIGPDGSGEGLPTESQRAMYATTTPAARTPTRPAPVDSAEVLPSAFGRYEVRRVLGAGGFGTVYLAHDTQLDRAVAIKVLHVKSASSETEQFFQEARKLAQLRHPGIVTVHDVGTHEGRVYVVSDYLDGSDLSRWLAENRMSWPEATRIVASVADALAHAHERLVVHRDVKPANIIILAGDRSPVLVDFGLALDESGAGGREKGMISGTPWYMSPEQAAGAAHRIDGRMDIYSLGVVLYEMLTGRVPFRAANFAELLRQVREDEPQPLRQLARDVPVDLERICLKALAKGQHDRYATAADFADDLKLVLGTATPSAYHPPLPPMPTPASQSSASDLSSLRSRGLSQASSRRPAREAERRQVTVVACACDLFESDTYLEFDAEDQAKMLRAFAEACQRPLRELDGTIVQCNEAGLLACFGYPVAYEDGAQRAARAGLGISQGMQELQAELRREHELEINVWVGIHTGPAVVEARDDTVSLVGEARNVAVRLGAVAEPGQVICTEAAHRLFRGRFACASLGERQIKGLYGPVELFHVQSAAAPGSDLPRPGGLSPLTGRDHEISLLKERWEQAQEAMGQIVLLVGEPGLGKSRLVQTMKEHVLGKGVEGEVDAPVVEWRCSPQCQNTGLYPAIDFYGRALGFGRGESPATRFDRLLGHLEQYGLARPETVPLWASLLSLPTPDRFPPRALSPVRQREETFDAMLEWLHTRAAQTPILFVVEDLHWVDASTLEFLGQFLAEGLYDRILTVLTFRPEFRTPWPAVANQTSLALTRLTRRQVGELMRGKAGDSLPDAVIEQVYDRTSGVPLFVEEFTRMVQEAGVLHAEEGDGPPKALPAHAIPATLQDLVMARVDRMEGERELAQLAAVLGREFSYELLSAVANLDEATLQAELASLAQAEILYPKGRPPRCTYIFKHALLEDALYNALVKNKRQQFHARVGEVLETQFPQTAETQPELLAHHFTEAALTNKAIGYWFKAGLRSRERSANREAIGHLTKGLSLLAALEETAERDARELPFLAALGPTYIAVRGYAAPEVGPVLLRARELCERTGDLQQLLGIMLGIWEWRVVRGDLALCRGLAAEGRALAERTQDPGMLMEALFMSGTTHFYRAEFAAARDCCQNAVASYDDRERTRFWTAYTGHNAGITHRCYLALALWHLGYPDQALKIVRETRELARTIGHPFSLGHALDFTAFLCHYCRLGAEVQAAAEEEIAVATEQGFQLWHALGILHKGAATLLQGHHEDGLSLLLKGFGAFQATGAEVRVPSYLALLGEAYTKAGRFDDARRALSDGLAIAGKNDDLSHVAELHRLGGELLLAESAHQLAAVEECFRRAIETAQRQGSKGWELRATTSLARLCQQQGRTGEARAALAAVYNRFTEGFSLPDLVDAEQLLRTLGHAR